MRRRLRPSQKSAAVKKKLKRLVFVIIVLFLMTMLVWLVFRLVSKLTSLSKSKDVPSDSVQVVTDSKGHKKKKSGVSHEVLDAQPVEH